MFRYPSIAHMQTLIAVHAQMRYEGIQLVTEGAGIEGRDRMLDSHLSASQCAHSTRVTPTKDGLNTGHLSEK